MPSPIVFPVIEPIPYKAAPKDQALKVLEEAAELVEAIKEPDDGHALYEFADTLQALATLVYLMRWTSDDLNDAYRCVHDNNVIRGRYEVDNA